MFRDFFIEAWSYIRPRTPDEKIKDAERRKITLKLMEAAGPSLLQPHAKFLATCIVDIEDPGERERYLSHKLKGYRTARDL